MPELTDEEKAKAFENAVETSKREDESDKKGEAESEEDKNQVEETEETNSEESTEDNSESTLTKPYDWLKGESPEDWVKELSNAYDNSTKGALTLKQERDDALKIVEEAKKIVATGGKTEEQSSGAPSTFDLSNVPEIQWVRGLQQKQIQEAYDVFAKKYPQASEPGNIQKVQESVPGLGQALEKALGRQPTYQEIFDGAANLLGWKPDESDKQAKKDAAIKEVSASSGVQSSAKSASKTKITEEQLEVARKLFPGQNDAEIVKGLSQYV